MSAPWRRLPCKGINSKPRPSSHLPNISDHMLKEASPSTLKQKYSSSFSKSAWNVQVGDLGAHTWAAFLALASCQVKGRMKDESLPAAPSTSTICDFLLCMGCSRNVLLPIYLTPRPRSSSQRIIIPHPYHHYQSIINNHKASLLHRPPRRDSPQPLPRLWITFVCDLVLRLFKLYAGASTFHRRFPSPAS